MTNAELRIRMTRTGLFLFFSFSDQPNIHSLHQFAVWRACFHQLFLFTWSTFKQISLMSGCLHQSMPMWIASALLKDSCKCDAFLRRRHRNLVDKWFIFASCPWQDHFVFQLSSTMSHRQEVWKSPPMSISMPKLTVSNHTASKRFKTLVCHMLQDIPAHPCCHFAWAAVLCSLRRYGAPTKNCATGQEGFRFLGKWFFVSFLFD